MPTHRQFDPPKVAPIKGAAAVRPGAPGVAQPKAAGGYTVTVGAYMHGAAGAALPAQLAGHSFVAVETPGGRKAWGFSPAGFDPANAQRNLGKLAGGTPGKLHADAGAFAQPGVRTQTFAVSPQQAQAALAKVAQYRNNTPAFSMNGRQCTTFATDVLRAAGVQGAPTAARKPGELYQALGPGRGKGA